MVTHLQMQISRQPHNSTKSYQPTRANTPQPNELEYLDVFDLFNFPRLPAGADNVENGNTAQISGQNAAVPDLAAMDTSAIMPNFAVPNPDTDWLYHAQ
jgi:hypothetical protein